jgi:hypothetical protein
MAKFQPGDRVRFRDFMEDDRLSVPRTWRDGIVLYDLQPDVRVWDVAEHTSELIEGSDCELVSRAIYMTPGDIAAVESTMCSGFRNGDTSPCTNDCSCAVINAFLGVGSES